MTQFIKHEVENAGDWSEWVDPDADSFLMKCCDCGLVHEMQFRVAVFADSETEEFIVLTDQNTKAQFRAKRYSTKGKEMTTPLPEPTYYLASNGRLMKTDGDVDCTGKQLTIYTETQLRDYGAAEFQRGLEEAANVSLEFDACNPGYMAAAIRALGETS